MFMISLQLVLNKYISICGSYTFHYSVDDQLTTLCMTDQQFDRRAAFAFLNEAQNRFMSQYGIPSDIQNQIVFQNFQQELIKLMVGFYFISF
jgi:hypothetical protein